MNQAAAQTHGDAADIIDTLIIGAGFSGLAMAIRLQQKGKHNFLVLERADEVGGAWRDNSYPGIACDIPSHLYSYSFRLNPNWSQTFSPGSEILQYLKNTAREEGIYPHIRFRSEVSEMRWDESAHLWTLRAGEQVYKARFITLAIGHLADWKLPNLPGIESFAGEILHSAGWKHDLVLEGRRIGVVGSGASAIQIVPELAKIAGELVVFQRTPPWVMPRNNNHYTAGEKRLFQRDPATMKELRDRQFWFNENRFIERANDEQAIKAATKIALDSLAAQVPDPELRAKLTPDYRLGCKRVLRSDDYYTSLTRPNVHLEASALASIDGAYAESADGHRFELDVLVFATGFEPTEPPYTRFIYGKQGRLLSEQWQSGMQAFASSTVHNFPNLFLLGGPNSGLGHNSQIYMIESQVNYVLEALDYIEAQQLETLEVKPEAEEAYVVDIAAGTRQTVWALGGCNSWYIDQRSGRLTISWPRDAYSFRQRNSHFIPDAYTADKRTDAAAA